MRTEIEQHSVLHLSTILPKRITVIIIATSLASIVGNILSIPVLCQATSREMRSGIDRLWITIGYSSTSHIQPKERWTDRLFWSRLLDFCSTLCTLLCDSKDSPINTDFIPFSYRSFHHC